MIPNKDNYTNIVKYRVKKSIYNLLLTDRDNIIIDLLKFVNNILENREELLINEIDLLENMIELKNIVDIVDNRIDNRVDIRFFYLFLIFIILFFIFFIFFLYIVYIFTFRIKNIEFY